MRAGKACSTRPHEHDRPHAEKIMNKAAIELLRRARAGDARACIDLAVAYAQGGMEASPNPRAALAWLARVEGPLRDEALAWMGDLIPTALLESAGCVAEALVRGVAARPSPRMKRKAALYFLRAGSAPHGFDAHGCLAEAAREGDHLAQIEIGFHAPSAEAAAGDCATPAAELRIPGWNAPEGHLSEQLVRCTRVLADGDPAHLPAAIAHLERLARRGVGEAALALARHHAGEPAGARERLAWLAVGAKAGSAEAQEAFGLASMESVTDADGTVLRPRWKLAHHWLSAAAQQGRAGAAWALYQLHRNRAFATRDPLVRREALERAAELGHAEAAYVLAQTLARSTLREASASESLRWLARAAAAGHAPAVDALQERSVAVPPRPAALREWQRTLLRGIARTAPEAAARLELAASLRLGALEAAFLRGDEMLVPGVFLVRAPRAGRATQRAVARRASHAGRVLRIAEGDATVADVRAALEVIARAADGPPDEAEALALEHLLHRRGVTWEDFLGEAPASAAAQVSPHAQRLDFARGAAA
jgi:TPR repeat protein